MKMTNKDVSDAVSENQTYVVWAVYHQDSDIAKGYFIINKVINKIHSSWPTLLGARNVASDLNKEIDQRVRLGAK